MNERNEPMPAEPSREERKLRRLLRPDLGGRELSDIVSSSSEATADLFASEYKPETEQGEALTSWEEEAK